MRTVQLKVSDHPWRCIDEDGVHCPWLRVGRFGKIWSCAIFSKPVDKWHEPLEERDGCLVRMPECLAAEITTSEAACADCSCQQNDD